MVSSEDDKDRSQVDIPTRRCPKCGKEIKSGKKRKKFCNDHCQHIYNQRLRRSAYAYAQSINSILLKNRNILHRLLPQDSKNIKISRDTLVKNKFQFDYHTQLIPAKNGGLYIYCYEYGYLALKKEMFMIIRKDFLISERNDKL